MLLGWRVVNTVKFWMYLTNHLWFFLEMRRVFRNTITRLGYISSFCVPLLSSSINPIKKILDFYNPNNSSFVAQLREQIEYPLARFSQQSAVKDKACQYSLFCLAANTEFLSIPLLLCHYQCEWTGFITLSGQDITGYFCVHASNALKAEENLIVFLLTFWNTPISFLFKSEQCNQYSPFHPTFRFTPD